MMNPEPELLWPAAMGAPVALTVMLTVDGAAAATASATHVRNADATALLLDQFDRERWGGTGELFDWTLIPGERRMPIVLAGGLTADNVAEALRVVRPYAVDVSGGVESERGVKDPAKIEQFLRGVMSV